MDEAGSHDDRFQDDSHALLELSRKLTASLDLGEVLDETVAALRRLVDFDTVWIHLYNDGALRLARRDPAGAADEAEPVEMGGRIARTRRVAYSPDIARDPQVKDRGPFAGDRAAASYWGAPLEFHDRCLGVLQIVSPHRDAFVAEDRARLLAAGPIIASALNNALVYEAEHLALEQLRRTQRTRRDSVTIVSHELRTPLAVILGFASAIADNAEKLEPGRISDLARRIIGSGRRLDRLIADLLDLSRIERGVLPVEVRPLSVRDILDSAGFAAEGRSPSMEVIVEDDLPPVMADEHRMHQILNNLIGNATKFSPPGTPVELSARRKDETVEVTVADHGPGIGPEHLAHVFEPFFQTGDKGGGGVGLGLYLVREICGAMGARVEIDSALGRGTRVVVSLPLATE